MIKRTMMLFPACAILAGCASTKLPTSIPGGEAKVFEAPKYVVLGKTRYDQNWIDSQVEGGVAAFGWPRPAPRPPELDGPVPRKVAVKKPKKKPGVFRRIKDRVFPKKKSWPDGATEPVKLAPLKPVVIEDPTPKPSPPKPRRDPVDELLQPLN